MVSLRRRLLIWFEGFVYGLAWKQFTFLSQARETGRRTSEKMKGIKTLTSLRGYFFGDVLKSRGNFINCSSILTNRQLF